MYIDIKFIYNLSLNTNSQPTEQCKMYGVGLQITVP